MHVDNVSTCMLYCYSYPPQLQGDYNYIAVLILESTWPGNEAKSVHAHAGFTNSRRLNRGGIQ